MKKNILLAGLAILAAVSVGCTGCQQSSAGHADPSAAKSETSAAGARSSVDEDGPDGRTVVTMMYPTDLADFEALVEKTYPDIDLQIELNAEATMDGESERRLNNHHGTDIVTTTMPTGNVRNYVMDLSAEPYVDRYQTAIYQNVSYEGKTMFIPLPGQYYGYIYNQTLLEQGNIPVPSSRKEILDMLNEAAAQHLGVGEDGTLFGVTSTMSTISSWLIATQVPDFLGLTDGVIWHRNLLDKNATFSEGMSHCLDMLSVLAKRGYINARVLYINHSPIHSGNAIPLEDRMLNGSMIMMYGTTRFLTFLNQNSEEYDFAMLPFMGNNGNSPWTITIPDAYLSINAELTAPGEEKRLAACSQILDLLSTPEGQKAYIDDCGTGHSYLTSYDSGQGDIPDGLRGCIENGYIYNIQIPAMVLNFFGRQMIQALNGEITLDEALKEVDQYYLYGNEEADYDQTLIGLVAEDMLYENYNVRLQETALGNLVADAAREQTQTQFAFVNGGSIRGSLYAGNVFGEDLDTICPYGNYLITLKVDGATVRAMLANGISAMVQDSEIPGGRFLNVSGLHYSFRPPAENTSGELLEVTLEDGSPLDDKAYYTITVTNYMAGSNGYLDNNGDGYTMLNLYSDDVPRAKNVQLLSETEYTFADALQNYFASHNEEAIVSRCEGRIKVVTDHD